MTRPAQGSTLPSDRDRVPGLSGGFVEDGGDTWYRIDGIESTPPFFVALAGDSDLWVFASTAGSLTAAAAQSAAATSDSQAHAASRTS